MYIDEGWGFPLLGGIIRFGEERAAPARA